MKPKGYYKSTGHPVATIQIKHNLTAHELCGYIAYLAPNNRKEAEKYIRTLIQQYGEAFIDDFIYSNKDIVFSKENIDLTKSIFPDFFIK